MATIRCTRIEAVEERGSMAGYRQDATTNAIVTATCDYWSAKWVRGKLDALLTDEEQAKWQELARMIQSRIEREIGGITE